MASCSRDRCEQVEFPREAPSLEEYCADKMTLNPLPPFSCETSDPGEIRRFRRLGHTE